MSRKKHDERHKPEPEKREQSSGWEGAPTTGGSAPGGARTGLRHQTDLTATGGGAESVRTGGSLPTGAAGGTGTGAGGLATGPAGIGGTRNLTHGAGRPAAQPGAEPPPNSGGTTETSSTAEEDRGAARSGEASTRSGSGGVEPEEAPNTSIRGAGSGRR